MSSDEEGTAFSGGFIIAFILVGIVVFFGPVTDSVYPKNYAMAEAACEPHEGLVRVTRVDYVSRRFKAYCTSGTMVRLKEVR